jgi:hypothetical protein
LDVGDSPSLGGASSERFSGFVQQQALGPLLRIRQSLPDPSPRKLSFNSAKPEV